MKGFRQFWRKYDFPLQLWALRNIAAHALATVLWTVWARCKLRAFGAVAGPGLRVTGRLHVFARRRRSIIIGRNVTLVSRSRSNPVGLTHPVVLDTLGGGQISIGDGSGLSGAVLSSRMQIKLGRHVKLGGNVHIFDHDYHALDSALRRDPTQDGAAARSEPVVLEDDVFVGANTILLKGTRLGARTIVGAGAVVGGLDAPPDSLVIGNPAQIVGR